LTRPHVPDGKRSDLFGVDVGFGRSHSCCSNACRASWSGADTVKS
jgi:hypothetical protein